MTDSKNQNILFTAAMITLANEVGPEEAVKKLFSTLDNRVRYQELDKIMESLFREFEINPGVYVANEGYENEDHLQKVFIEQLESLLKSSVNLR